MPLTESNNKILADQMKLLPKELTGLLTEGEFEFFAESLTQAFNLTEEQTKQLSNELLLAFLMLVPLHQLPHNLVTNVSVSQVNAKLILREIIQSEFDIFIWFILKVSDQSDDSSDEINKLIFGNGESKSKQDYINEEMIAKYHIEASRVPQFINIIENVVLGFNKIADTSRLFQREVGLSPEEAQRLTADLIDAWEPIVKREEEEAQEKKAAVMSLADKIEAIEPTQVAPKPAAQPEVQPTESEEITPAAPIRTMQSDVNHAHGYGAVPQPTVEEPETEPTFKAITQDELRPPTA